MKNLQQMSSKEIFDKIDELSEERKLHEWHTERYEELVKQQSAALDELGNRMGSHSPPQETSYPDCPF